jgi:protein SEY1
MDALAGRNQTTRGIWLAAAGLPPPGGSAAPPLPSPPSPPLTLVLDLEGADGRERGEDDASFERQTALFAMAVADVLVVNMWAKDVGREAGAGKPLLRTIFTVDLKLRAAAGLPARAAAASAAAAGGVSQTPSSPQKRVLLFAFRDRTRTPLPTLAAAWAADLEALWAGLAKPAGLAAAPLSDIFELRYTALPNYEDAEDAFRTEVADLRARFDSRAPDSLVSAAGGATSGSASSAAAAAGGGRLPGSALPLSFAKMWEVVRSQRDLNLPAHKVREEVAGLDVVVFFFFCSFFTPQSLPLSIHSFLLFSSFLFPKTQQNRLWSPTCGARNWPTPPWPP